MADTTTTNKTMITIHITMTLATNRTSVRTNITTDRDILTITMKTQTLKSSLNKVRHRKIMCRLLLMLMDMMSMQHRKIRLLNHLNLLLRTPCLRLKRSEANLGQLLKVMQVVVQVRRGRMVLRLKRRRKLIKMSQMV